MKLYEREEVPKFDQLFIVNRKGDEIFSFIKQKQNMGSYFKSFGRVFYYMEIRFRMTKIDRNKNGKVFRFFFIKFKLT